MVLALLLLALAAPINLTAINEQQGHVVHSLPGRNSPIWCGFMRSAKVAAQPLFRYPWMIPKTKTRPGRFLRRMAPCFQLI